MAATREDVNRWIEKAKKEGFEYILSVCDTFEYEDYPVYFASLDELLIGYSKYDNNGMQKINEIIHLSEDIVKEGLSLSDIPLQLELRMYFFVPYNISPIQQAIQAGHAALEYANQYGETQLFKDFVNKHKTWIILNGGTTNNDISNRRGTLQLLWDSIIDFNFNGDAINSARFSEPDLNDAMTAICFICDERAWNLKKYPHFNEDLYQDNESEVYPSGQNIRDHDFAEWKKKIGDKNIFLRELLKDKRLA